MIDDADKPSLLLCEIRDVTFGRNVRVVRPCNLYECTIEDDCFIGPFVEIQRGVRVGARTKVQSHSFVCELVEIGADCFVGHGVMFINDDFAGGSPAHGDRSRWRSTRVGDSVSIGSNATLLPVNICARAVIGAGSVVTRDIVEPGVYAGSPAKRLRSL